jgi:hypothetical protein
MGRASVERVIVFIDWQNVYKGARTAFHGDRGSSRLGMVDPVRLSQRLIQLSYGRGRELTEVRVYRGRPDPTRLRRQPAPAGGLGAVRRDRGAAAAALPEGVAGREGAVVGLGGNRGPRAEVAAWTSSRAAPRLRIAGARLWCHYLRVGDYRGMVDPSDYTIP